MSYTFQAGCAIVDITPDRPLPDYNGNIVRTGSASNFLKSHIIVCSDGKTTCAIISTDTTFLDDSIVLAIREKIQSQTGIKKGNILIAATHTHAAPATARSFLSGALPDADYVDFLIERIVQGTKTAAAGLTDAIYMCGTLPSPVGWCRRFLDENGQSHMMPEVPLLPGWVPENEIDREMQFLAFESIDGEPIAFVFGVPCHNNFTSGVYDSDMFGRAGQFIRERLGEHIATAGLLSPSGDVAARKPDEYQPPAQGKVGWDSSRNDDQQRSMAAGKDIARLILDAYYSTKRRPCSKLVVSSHAERMPDRLYEDSHFCYDNCRGSDAAMQMKIRKRFDPEEAAVKTRGQTYYDVEIQCIGFGAAAIVTNPGEFFSIYGTRIKSASPFEVTLISGLTNGYCGYVPSPESFAHGGYETHRTVHTSRLVKDAADCFMNISLEQLGKVWNQLAL